MEEKVSFTATISTRKYSDKTIDDLIAYVRGVQLGSDAVENAKRILDKYKKRLTVWELIKLLFNR